LCQQLRDLITLPIGKWRKRSGAPCSRTSSSRETRAARREAPLNLFLYDRAAVPDPERIITGGHQNKAARIISLYQEDTIDAPALTTMLKQIIANNRAHRSPKHSRRATRHA
jgi:hypothetical protein